MYVTYNEKINAIGDKGATEDDAWLDHHDTTGSPDGYKLAVLGSVTGCSRKHVYDFENGISYII
jgi:hypothetical protein